MRRKFDIFIGIEEAQDLPKTKRLAVRGVIIKDQKILLVKSNRGDYKFPGGGVEDGEDLADALIREIEEETGYKNANVKHAVGQVVERKKDTYDNKRIFEMLSYYYICEVDEEKTKQRLDAYEKALDFKPQWVRIEVAIQQNELYLENNPSLESWVKRENLVLKRILEWDSSQNCSKSRKSQKSNR